MNPTTIELPAAELKTALTGLGKVISRRTTLPVLEHLRVTRDKAGIITLQATDLDSFVRYEAEQLGASEPCEFLVPFEPLNKLVKGGKEPVQISLESKNKVRLKTYVGSSPMEQTLDTLPVDEFPLLPLTSGKVVPTDATFRDSFRQALDCCSEDGSRRVIQHVCLDTRYTEGHYLAATDGRHLFSANSFHFDLKEPVLIPNQAFLRWNKFMEDGVGELSVKPKTKTEGPWVQLKSGRWTFIAKSPDEEFPKWKNVLPAPNSSRTRIQFDSQAVATLLAGVPRLPASDDCLLAVTLEVIGNGLHVKARAKDAKDWTRLTVDGARVHGRPVSVSLKREYLLKALRFGLTTVEIENDLSPLDFYDGGRRMIVMPVRPDGASQPATSAPTTQPNPQPSPAPDPSPDNNSNPPVSEPPQAQPQQPTTMPKTIENTPTEAPTETSPVKAVIQHIEAIKDTLKGVLKEFAEVLDCLKQLEKEKKASDREMDSVREKLREIQAVRI